MMNIDVYKAPDSYAHSQGQEFILLVIKNALVFVVSKDEAGIKGICHGPVENSWMAKDIMKGEDAINREDLPAVVNDVIDMLPETMEGLPANPNWN